jgi:hypothetical protein
MQLPNGLLNVEAGDVHGLDTQDLDQIFPQSGMFDPLGQL